MSTTTLPQIWDINHISVVAAMASAGLVGATTWDIVSNVGPDYRLLRQSNSSIPNAAYFIARFSILISLLLLCIINTSEVEQCALFLKASSVFVLLSLSSISFLFFIRVRAIYCNNHYITCFFGVLWLAIPITSVDHILQSDRGYDIRYPICPSYSIHGLTMVVAWSGAPMVYDTLIFSFITWRLFQNACVTLKLKDGLKVIAFGSFLPALSKTLLQDNQMYFLTMIIIQIFTLIAYNSTNHSDTFNVLAPIWLTIGIVVTNLLGCRIYRHTKLRLGACEVLSEPSSIMFGSHSANRDVQGDPEVNTQQAQA